MQRAPVTQVGQHNCEGDTTLVYSSSAHGGRTCVARMALATLLLLLLLLSAAVDALNSAETTYMHT